MKPFSGRTTEDYENYENALGDEIYGTPLTDKEKKESRHSFVEGLKAAVVKGGRVEVEAFTTGKGVKVRNFSFKLNNSCQAYSISEEDAVKYCGYEQT